PAPSFDDRPSPAWVDDPGTSSSSERRMDHHGLSLGSDRTRRADRLLFLAMAVLAGLLGCYELFDTDVWWHLRTGRWILEHRRVPRLDLFTFSSADRPWIDLHWGFQVALATAHAMGGVPAMVLLAALASAAAVAIAVTAR